MASLWILTGVVFWFTSCFETPSNNAPDIDLPMGFPLRSCNLGCYRKRRRQTNFFLRQRTGRRPKERPKRDPVMIWWKPSTWILIGQRRIPIPRVKEEESWWSRFFTEQKKQKRSTRRHRSDGEHKQKGTSSRPKGRRRNRPDPNKRQNRQWDHTFGESEQQQKYEYEQIKHRLIHQSWIMFDMQFGISIDDLLGDTDPT